jgi:hypothetical protein
MAEISMANVKYSQVELNRCAFLHDGAIESQCVADEDLQNGEIVVINKAEGKIVKATGSGEDDAVYGLNYTSERIYNQFAPGRKNFYVAAGEYPRVGILAKGDIFTTDATIPSALIDKVVVVVDANADCADGTPAKKYMVL